MVNTCLWQRHTSKYNNIYFVWMCSTNASIYLLFINVSIYQYYSPNVWISVSACPIWLTSDNLVNTLSFYNLIYINIYTYICILVNQYVVLNWICLSIQNWGMVFINRWCVIYFCVHVDYTLFIYVYTHT